MNETPSKSLSQVLDEYSVYKAGGGNLDLESYASAMDVKEGTQLRKSAYNVGTLQRINNFVDQTLKTVAQTPLVQTPENLTQFSAQLAQFLPDSTFSPETQQGLATLRQLPAASGTIPSVLGSTMEAVSGPTESIFDLQSGSLKEPFRKIGEDAGLNLPRQVARTAPMMIPGVGPLAALLPGTADTALQTYSEAKESGSENPALQAGIAAGGFAAAPSLFRVGASGVGSALAKTPLTSPAVQRMAEMVGGNVLQTAGGQLQTNLEGLASGKSLDQVSSEMLSPENLGQQVAGQLPWLPQQLHETMSPQKVRVDTAFGSADLPVPTHTEAARFENAANYDAKTALKSELGQKVLDFISPPKVEGPEQSIRNRVMDFKEALTPEELEKVDPLMVRMRRGVKKGDLEGFEEFRKVINEPVGEFSLTSPSGKVDFSGERAVAPEEVVRAIVSESLVPTGLPGNEDSVQKAELLKETVGRVVPGLSTRGVMMGKAKELAELGQMVKAVKVEGLEGESKEKWDKLNLRQKEAAVLLGDIWKDPRSAIGLGEQLTAFERKGERSGKDYRWSAQDRSEFVGSVEQSAADVLGEYGEANTVKDFAQLVKGTNGIIENVNKFVVESGLTRDTLVQEMRGSPIKKLDEAELQRIVENEREKSGFFEGELESRVLEQVKARLLLARDMAHATLREVSANDETTRAGIADFNSDKEFVGSLEGMPSWFSELVGSRYAKASEVSSGTGGARVSKLDNFRENVGNALKGLSPEQREAVQKVVVPEGFSVEDLGNLSRKAVEQRFETKTTDEDNQRVSKEDEGFGEEESEKKVVDSKSLVRQKVALEKVKEQLEKIPVNVGESRSNMWDLLHKSYKEKMVEAGSERREVEGEEADIALEKAESEDSAMREVRGDKSPLYSEEAGTNAELEQEFVSKYFDKVGTEGSADPVENVLTASPAQIRDAFLAVFSEKGLTRKSNINGPLKDSVYMKTASDGRNAATEFIRDVMAAEFGSDPRNPQLGLEQRKKVIEKLYGKPYEEVYKKGSVDWNTVRALAFNDYTLKKLNETGALSSLKALMSGYKPKAGVNLEQVGVEYKEKKAKSRGPSKQFRYDLQQSIRIAAESRGLSQEWVNRTMPSIERVLAPFTKLEHAKFAMIANPKLALDEAMNSLRVLGVAIPAESVVNGQRLRNPVIGMDIEEMFKQFKYKDVVAYHIVTTAAHEAFHVFESEVVKKYSPDMPAYEKAQVKAYTDLLNNVQSLTEVQRTALAQDIVDVMIPSARTRSIGPDGKSRLDPAWQSYIRGAVRSPEEFAAFVYSHSVAGMAGSGVRSERTADAVSNVQRRMRLLNDDVREFVRGQFRNLADYTHVLQAVMDDPEYKRSIGLSGQPIGRGLYETEPKTQVNVGIKGVDTPVETTLKEETKFNPTSLKGRGVIPPATEGVKSNVLSLINAAQSLAKGEWATRKFGENESTKRMGTIIEELGKIDDKIVEVEAMLGQMDKMLSGPGYLEDGVKPEGIQVLKTSMLNAPSQLSALIPAKLGNEFQQAADYLSGKGPNVDPRFRESAFMRLFALVPQKLQSLAAKGVDVARDASDALNWSPLQHNLNDLSYYHLTTRFGKLGTTKLDETKEFHQFFYNGKDRDERASVAFNKITLALNGAEDVDNRLNSSFAMDVIGKNVQGLSDKQKGIVLEALQQAYSVSKSTLTNSYLGVLDSHKTRLAAVLLTTNNGANWKSSKDFAEKTLQFIRLLDKNKDPVALQNAEMGLNQLAAQLRLDPKSVELVKSLAIDLMPIEQKLEGLMARGRNFVTEQRYGRYAVAWDVLDKAGQKVDTGAMGFDDLLQAKKYLQDGLKEGKINFRIRDTSKDNDQVRMAQAFPGFEAAADEMQAVFDKQLAKIQAALGPNSANVIDTVKGMFNPTAELAKAMTTSQLEKNMMQRRFAPGREDIDYLSNLHNYVHRTNAAVARQTALNKLNLISLELKNQGHNELASDLMTTFHASAMSEDPLALKVRQLVSAKYMAANIPNALIETTNVATVSLPMLTQEVGTQKALGALVNASTKLAKFYLTKNPDETLTKLAEVGRNKKLNGYAASKDEEIAAHFQAMLDERRLSSDMLTEDYAQDTINLNLARPRIGEMDWVDKGRLLADKATNGALWVARTTAWLKTFLTDQGQRLSAYAALEAGYDQGLRGDSLRLYANTLLPNMTFVGGRYIRPVVAQRIAGSDSKVVRNVFTAGYVLQNWNAGLTTMFAKQMHDAVMNDTSLTPQQRKNARQAAGTSLLILGSLGGAFAIPGIGAAVAITKQLFDVGEEDLRIGLDNLMGGDAAMGSLVSDLAFNGIVNNLTGIDLASKSQTQNIFGWSPDNGFDMTKLFGPTVSTIADLSKATKETIQGDPLKGATTAAPSALKPALKLGRALNDYGDTRIIDSKGNFVEQPQGLGVVRYLANLSSADTASKARERRLAQVVEENAQSRHNAELDNYARQLFKGNTTDILLKAQQESVNPNFNPKSFIDSVIDRAIDLETPYDPMGYGSKSAAKERSALGRTFDNERQSAVKRLQKKGGYLMMMGNPYGLKGPQTKDYIKASLVDQVMQARGVGRTEALGIVEKELGM